MAYTDNPELTDRIVVYEGELIEGSTVEFKFDFDCDALSNTYPLKRWVVLAEKNIRYSEDVGRYYYEHNQGDIIENESDDYVTVENLVPGRVFVFFEYEEKLYSNMVDKNLNGLIAKCELDYFDFSSHADKNHLYDYIDNLKFSNDSHLAFCVHGEEKSVNALASTLNKNKYYAVAPENGESYII